MRAVALAALLGASPVLVTCSSGSSAPPAGSGSSSVTANSLDAAYTKAVDAVSPAVVLIRTAQGLGSGVVYDRGGDIVTNAHVVGSATTFRVTMSNGKDLPGTLVGSYPPDDIAVVKVNGAGLEPATFGDSSKLQVGQPAIAIGNPLGLQGSVTSGVISALGRIVPEGQGGGTLPDAVQTSAAINPGNSGGALANLDGQVIGIPTLAALSPETMGAPAPGIGFAISSNRAKLIADQLIKNGRVTNSHRAYLGVRVADTTTGHGVLVVGVEPGGPAAKAGIREGDLVTSVVGKPTATSSELAAVLAGLSPGQTVQVDVTHADGSRASVRVTLGQLPPS